jgi:integrase
VIRRNERKSGPRFEVYAQRDGKKVFVDSFGTRQEAEIHDERYRVTQMMIADGDLPPEANLARTFEEAAREWMASLTRSKRRSAPSYQKRLDLYISPAFAKVPISRFTMGSVMAWRDAQSERFQPGTVNASLTTLSSAFTYFRKRQWIAINPCHGVERIEDPIKAFAWIHTREEMTRLLMACNDELRDIVATALGSGLRFDELLHLQWADVDLEHRLLTVHRGRQGTVKSGKLRRVPILDSVLAVLKARALKRAGAILVFPSESGRVRDQKNVRVIYKLAVTRAQLDERLRFHDLRHTFASHWMMSGGCIFKLSKVLGHSSVAITEKVYAHLAPTAFEADYC